MIWCHIIQPRLCEISLANINIENSDQDYNLDNIKKMCTVPVNCLSYFPCILPANWTIHRKNDVGCASIYTHIFGFLKNT